MGNPPSSSVQDHAPQEGRPELPIGVRLEELIGPQAVRDDEDEAVGGRGDALGDGVHAVDDGALEVDVEDAQHVDRVQSDPEENQPSLPTLHLLVHPPAPQRRRSQRRRRRRQHTAGSGHLL